MALTTSQARDINTLLTALLVDEDDLDSDFEAHVSGIRAAAVRLAAAANRALPSGLSAAEVEHLWSELLNGDEDPECLVEPDTMLDSIGAFAGYPRSVAG